MTTTLDQLATTDANKEGAINENFKAVGWTGAFGPRPAAHSGLTWAFYGGRVGNIGSFTDIANGTQVLTASTTTYFELDPEARTLHFVTGSFTGGRIPLFILVTDGSSVTSETDCRTAYRDNFNDIAYAASITPNLNNGEIVDVGTLTGNITINAPTNMVKGHKLVFMFAQDGLGPHTITWNAAFLKAADGAAAINEKAVTEFYYDGTDWIQLGGALAWY